MKRYSLVCRIKGLISVAVLVAVGCGLSSAAMAAAKPQNLSVLSKCRTDLAKRLKLKEQDIKLADAQPVTWPSAALGMPEIGKVYAQVLTPGQRFVLSADNRLYLYTTSSKAIRYGGPIYAWSYSMLYLKPVPNEPNLNRDLYQCSLIGTNPVRLASGVSEYYPQDKGSVIFKRRTSRSGYDLLYVEANQSGKEKMLYKAMDFGAAAFNADHTQWAAFVRPRLGIEWTVVIGRLGEDASKYQVLPMPEGMWPGQIVWSGDDLMILAKKDDKMVAFTISPKAESPTWKPVNNFYFPGQDKFVLNKSESLDISEIKKSDKPAVEVTRVWFTGDRNVVATISDFNMQGCDLIGPYAFIWGEKGSRVAAYSVDISSGVTVVSYPGAVSDIKPFAYRPYESPMPAQQRMD